MLGFKPLHLFDHKRIIIPCVAVLALTLFCAPNAFAGKPSCNPQKDPTCGQTNTLPLGADTDVTLLGTEISVAGSSHCTSGVGLTLESGNYYCSTTGKVLKIGLHDFGTPIASSRKSESLCYKLWGTQVNNSGDGDGWLHFRFAVDDYNYGWTESCQSGSCAVEIRFLISKLALVPDQTISSMTGGAADRAEVILLVDADSVTTDNPFDNDLIDLDVISVEADFKKPGSQRTAVTCLYPNASGGKAVFSSFAD